MPSASENNKRIAKNTVMLYFRMILLLLVSLYTSRVILNTLGVVDYGINNVVAGVITMLGFITSSLGAATSRFITFNLGKGDVVKLKRTWGNIVTMYLLLAVIILIAGETLGLWFVKTQLVIPAERMNAALWVYQFSIFSTMLGVISAPYNSVLIAHERMSAFAYISIADAVLKLVIVYLLQVIPYDKLIVYASLFFIIQCFDRIVYGVYCARHFDEVHAPLRCDGKVFREMLSYAGWTMNGSLAVIGYTQGLNVLLNLFFGPAVNAARGVAVQVQNICYQFSTNFLLATKPQIIKSYARGDLEYMHKLVLEASKFAFFILFFIFLPISLEAGQVLHWWLGIVPEHTENFLRLILCTSMLRCLATPIVDSVHATGRLKKFQIVEGTMLLTVVPIAYVMLKFFSVPPEAVFIVHIIVKICTQYARLKIVLPMISMRLMTYFRQVVVPIVLVVVISPIVPVIVYLRMEPSVLSFLTVCAVSVISLTATIYTLGMTTQERTFALDKARSVIKKIRK